MDPLMGYLKLAEKQYNKKINNMHHWNFGPNTSSFVSVNEIIKIVKKKYKLKTKIKYNQNFFETEILKLNSNKAKKYLNWKSKWNLQKSINSVIEWNYQLNKLNNARKICETQIEEYLK
jgi:CDP-glucose 4,6-dehydratase